MKGYNIIWVFNPSADKVLMCERKKAPYKGLLNLVGGKIEPDEDGLAAAYRELSEETGIVDITLTHLMDFTYYINSDCRVEVYVGQLIKMTDVYGDENKLIWVDVTEDFFETRRFAGKGNIGHIYEIIKHSYKNEIFNNLFYHASNVGELHELRPLSKMHNSKEAVCYFTPNKTYALFYLRDMQINHVTCGVNEEGIVVYHEQFPNQLSVIYGGRSGYIYSCANYGGIRQKTTGGIWVATEPISILDVEFINDVYAEIIKAEQAGKVRIIRYDEQTDEKKDEISEMWKRSILRNGLLHSTTVKTLFIKQYFPAAWQAAETDGYSKI